MARNNREKLQDALLHCRVPSGAKELWKQTAKANGKSLSQWIIEILNEEARRSEASRS